MLLGEDKLDFTRLPIPVFDERDAFKKVTTDLRRNLGELLSFLQESYNLVTLSIESNYRGIYDASARRIEYVGFLEKEYIGYFSRAVASVKHQKESRELLKMHTQFDYLFQIYDSIDDIFNTKKALTEHFVELDSDVLLMVRKLSSETLALFEEIHRLQSGKSRSKVEARAGDLQRLLDEIDGELLPLLAEPDRADVGTISNFVTYSRRLKDKLVNFADTYGN